MATIDNTKNDSNFILPDLSRQDIEKYKRIASSMAESLLETIDSQSSVPWALVHEKHGVALFRAELQNLGPCNVHGISQIRGDIHRVLDAMITTTTVNFCNQMKTMCDDFLDGEVLYNLTTPTTKVQSQYIGIKWMVMKNSTPFAKPKDYIILEYVDKITDGCGRDIVFHITQSIKVPGIRMPKLSSRYNRENRSLTGLVFYTSKKPGKVKMTYTGGVDRWGDLPSWAANSALHFHVEKNLNRILRYIEEWHINNEDFTLDGQVIPQNQGDSCQICDRQFTMLRRRNYCFKCGEVVCNKCSSLRVVRVPDNGERKLLLCALCVINSRNKSKRDSARNSGRKRLRTNSLASYYKLSLASRPTVLNDDGNDEDHTEVDVIDSAKSTSKHNLDNINTSSVHGCENLGFVDCITPEKKTNITSLESEDNGIKYKARTSGTILVDDKLRSSLIEKNAILRSTWHGVNSSKNRANIDIDNDSESTDEVSSSHSLSSAIEKSLEIMNVSEKVNDLAQKAREYCAIPQEGIVSEESTTLTKNRIFNYDPIIKVTAISTIKEKKSHEIWEKDIKLHRKKSNILYPHIPSPVLGSYNQSEVTQEERNAKINSHIAQLAVTNINDIPLEVGPPLDCQIDMSIPIEDDDDSTLHRPSSPPANVVIPLYRHPQTNIRNGFASSNRQSDADIGCCIFPFKLK